MDCWLFALPDPPPKASGPSLGAPICWRPCQGDLAPAPCLAPTLPASGSGPAVDPKSGAAARPERALRACLLGPPPHPQACVDTIPPQAAPPGLQGGKYPPLFLPPHAPPTKPNILILLIIEEQIFPKIIRQFKSYALSLRTIFNPDLDVITRAAPSSSFGSRNMDQIFLNVKCCIVVDRTELFVQSSVGSSAFLPLPQ